MPTMEPITRRKTILLVIFAVAVAMSIVLVGLARGDVIKL